MLLATMSALLDTDVWCACRCVARLRICSPGDTRTFLGGDLQAAQLFLLSSPTPLPIRQQCVSTRLNCSTPKLRSGLQFSHHSHKRSTSHKMVMDTAPHYYRDLIKEHHGWSNSAMNQHEWHTCEPTPPLCLPSTSGTPVSHSPSVPAFCRGEGVAAALTRCDAVRRQEECDVHIHDHPVRWNCHHTADGVPHLSGPECPGTDRHGALQDILPDNSVVFVAIAAVLIVVAATAGFGDAAWSITF